MGFEYQAKEFGCDAVGRKARGESRVGEWYDDHGTGG